MKYSIFIDKDREEEIVIYAKERTELIDKIEELLSMGRCDSVIGTNDNDIVVIQIGDIVAFSVSDGITWAVTEDGKYKTKLRLYQAEESFGADFLRINQSCIVRVGAIERFSASFGGSLTVYLKGGFCDYVSRRQLKTVKERIGF